MERPPVLDFCYSHMLWACHILWDTNQPPFSNSCPDGDRDESVPVPRSEKERSTAVQYIPSWKHRRTDWRSLDYRRHASMSWLRSIILYLEQPSRYVRDHVWWETHFSNRKSTFCPFSSSWEPEALDMSLDRRNMYRPSESRGEESHVTSHETNSRAGSSYNSLGGTRGLS
jgi:hypothetical protein